MAFLGQQTTLGLTDMLATVKLSLLLISSDTGSKVLTISERARLHSQITDVNSSPLACCLG